jgi:hypothetical protein
MLILSPKALGFLCTGRRRHGAQIFIGTKDGICPSSGIAVSKGSIRPNFEFCRCFSRAICIETSRSTISRAKDFQSRLNNHGRRVQDFWWSALRTFRIRALPDMAGRFPDFGKEVKMEKY